MTETTREGELYSAKEVNEYSLRLYLRVFRKKHRRNPKAIFVRDNPNGIKNFDDIPVQEDSDVPINTIWMELSDA